MALTALDEVATLLGPTWVDLEPLVAPSVDPRRLPVSSLPAALLTACLCLAQDGARELPSASEAWPRLEPLRPRVPALVLDALMTELRQL